MTQVGSWQQQIQTLCSSTAFRMYALLSHPVYLSARVPDCCFEGESLKSWSCFYGQKVLFCFDLSFWGVRDVIWYSSNTFLLFTHCWSPGRFGQVRPCFLCILEIFFTPNVLGWESFFAQTFCEFSSLFRTTVLVLKPDISKVLCTFPSSCETTGFSRKRQMERVWFPAAGRRFYQ